MFKDSLKIVFFNLARTLRYDVRFLRRIRQKDLLVVLNLHQISPIVNPFWQPLHPRLFDDLLSFLKHHFHIVLFRELEFVGKDKPAAILSFDDGYHNFVEYGLPILKKHGLKANMNIIPSCVESGLPPWNIQLYDFLNSVPNTLINEMRLPGFDIKLKGKDFSAKVGYGLKISRFLIDRPRHEREQLWKLIQSNMARADFETTRMMTAAEIQSLAGQHEIGTHSFSHESMGFEDNSFFEEDLSECFRYFQETLKLPLDVYAFPNGSYRKEQIEILQAKNIRHILLVGEAYSHRTQNVHPRFTIYGSSQAENRFQSLGFNSKRVAA